MKVKVKTLQECQKEVNDGYTLIYPVSEDELGYQHLNTLEEAEASALELIDDGETEIDDGDYSNIVFVIKGKVKPLKIIFTRSLKIVEE